MSIAAIKKLVDDYLPLLSTKQQTLVLEMIKSRWDALPRNHTPFGMRCRETLHLFSKRTVRWAMALLVW
jgi:hypothetical protein